MRTFEASRLDWNSISQSRHQEWLRFYRELLKLRCQHIVSRGANACGVTGRFEIHGDRGLKVNWALSDGAELILLANLGTEALPDLEFPSETVIYASEQVSNGALKQGLLPPWSAVWFLKS